MAAIEFEEVHSSELGKLREMYSNSVKDRVRFQSVESLCLIMARQMGIIMAK